MIASLRGTILNVGLISAIIETGGVGMNVQATPTMLSGLKVDKEAFAHTEMVVREDSLTLFGLADTDKRNSFRTLTNARSVGTKLALTMLTTHTPNALRRAIAFQDVAALTRVPDLGPRGTQRVILDVAGKLGSVTGGDLEAAQTIMQSVQGVEAMSDGGPEPHANTVAALVQLGWNEAGTQQMVSSVTVDTAGGGQEPDMAVVSRASLRWLGGGHRGWAR